VAGSCEHGNEPPGYIKGREFIEQLSDYQLLKKDYSVELEPGDCTNALLAGMITE
jgi:hypothetical protein